MAAPPPIREQQVEAGDAAVQADSTSGNYPPTAEFPPTAAGPYAEAYASYDLAQVSKRRRARWIILTLSGMVAIIVLATGLLVVKAVVASENARFQSAQKDYADGKYAAAGEKFEKLRENFPKSEHIDFYDFFASLSEVRDQVYRTNADPEEALKDLRKFTKHRAGDPLLPEYAKDVWHTYERSIEDVTTLAEQKMSQAPQAEVVRRLLTQAEKALEEAKTVAPKDQLSEETKKFAERFQKLDQAVTKQERRHELLAELKNLHAIPEDILRAERRARLEGQQEDPEVLEQIKRLKDQLISQVTYESSPSVPLSRGISESSQPGLLVTPRLEMNGAAGAAGSGVVLALARGVLYALAEKDGAILWATRCGFDVARLPVRLPANETAPEMVLVLSSETNTLTARDLLSGRVLWHYDLQAPCLGQPVVVGRRAYVPTLDGKVHEIEIVTGHLLGWYKLGLPLTVGGARLPGSNLVYFPADSLNVYVLDVNRQKCVGILQSGHEAGTLRSEPILVGGFDTLENNPNASVDARLLVLSQADGLGAMRLRAFNLPVEGAAPVSALQSEPRLRGWSWFQPHCDGEKIALATDAGVLGLFGLQQKGNEDKPIFAEGGQEISLGVNPGVPLRSEVIYMIDDDFWVLANGSLQRLHLDKYRQKLIPIWNRPLTLGSPLHDSQVNEKSKTLFTVTQSRQTYLTTAVAMEDGQVRWQRQLGMVCQADPLVLGTEILVLDQGGGLFRFDSAGFPNRSNAGWQTGGEILASAVENLVGEAFLLPGADGRSALEAACVQKPSANSERSFDLLVRRYEVGKNLVEKTFSLKTTRLGGTPALMGESLLVPLEDGSLLRQPLDGSRGGYGPGWRARTADGGARGHVIVLNAEDFLTTDGSRGLTRWHWPAGDVYKEDQHVDFPHRILSLPVLLKSEAGDQVCLADLGGQLHLLSANSLQEIRHWNLANSSAGEPAAPGAGAIVRITAGPFVRGSRLGCVVNSGPAQARRLVWIDPSQDKPLWDYATPSAGIVGQPRLVGDMIVAADLTGRFVGLDPASGKPLWPAGLSHGGNVAPAATPVPFGPDLAFVPLTDGTVFFLSLNHLRPSANREESEKEK
jgi:outer membrane protein assembly factor BamB